MTKRSVSTPTNSVFNLSAPPVCKLESIRDTGTWPPAFPKDGGLLATHVTSSLLVAAAVAAAADASA